MGKNPGRLLAYLSLRNHIIKEGKSGKAGGSMHRRSRGGRRMAVYAVIGCIGAGCLFFYTAPGTAKSAAEHAKNYLSGFVSALTEELVFQNYLFAAYHLEGGGEIRDTVADKMEQIVPLGSYVENKAGKKIWESTKEPESYPMLTPESGTEEIKESEQTTESSPDEEFSIPSGTEPFDKEMNAAASGILIEPQREILPQIRALPEKGSYTLEQMLDFQYLIEHLYVIDPGTSITENELNPRVLLAKDLSISQNGSGPQILIYHTHSQETFADSVPGEEEDTIVGVGDYLTKILTDTYGYQVLHHKGVYDMTDGVLDRDPAYEKALPDLEQILSDNPSIEVVIDLHRDGVDEDVRLVTDIDGKPTARLMFFNGTCRDANGERTDVSNPYREDNLAFSLQMALEACAEYPDLTRVIYLKTNRYNQHLRSRSALVEVGAQTNTVEEAMNAMPLLADLIHQVIHRGE